jgi:hypothetical protein
MQLVSRFRWILNSVLLLAALLSAASSAQASLTLADLLNGGSITFGDKVFYNFHNGTTSGTINVGFDQIFVDGVTGGPNNDEFGLRFSSSFWTLQGANQFYDLGFDFSVTRVDGLPRIHDNTLSITGGAVGDGQAFIAEGVTDGANGDTLANKFVFITPTVSRLIDHKIFTHDAAVVDIHKDFSMITGRDPNSLVFVSHFNQTFSQSVPEPSSMALIGIGLIGVAGMARKRMYRQTLVD